MTKKLSDREKTCRRQRREWAKIQRLTQAVIQDFRELAEMVRRVPDLDYDPARLDEVADRLESHAEGKPCQE